jgi:hypothetical protein
MDVGVSPMSRARGATASSDTLIDENDALVTREISSDSITSTRTRHTTRRMNMTTMHAEYRHRTPDLWAAAALWALGFSPTHVEVDGRQVIFVFPVTGDEIRDAARLIDEGKATVDPMLMKQGYFHARGLMRSGLSDAALGG